MVVYNIETEKTVETNNLYNAIMNYIIKMEDDAFESFFGVSKSNKNKFLNQFPGFVKMTNRTLSKDEKLSLREFLNAMNNVLKIYEVKLKSTSDNVLGNYNSSPKDVAEDIFINEITLSPIIVASGSIASSALSSWLGWYLFIMDLYKNNKVEQLYKEVYLPLIRNIDKFSDINIKISLSISKYNIYKREFDSSTDINKKTKILDAIRDILSGFNNLKTFIKDKYTNNGFFDENLLENIDSIIHVFNREENLEREEIMKLSSLNNEITNSYWGGY
ncbi:hypothetical protein ACNQ2A_02410 [Mycoplasma sp. 1458C]|uniref:hypothetical protein n=1 Tax=Mycoplasma TaxID=2093 RepID=UPI003A84BDD4